MDASVAEAVAADGAMGHFLKALNLDITTDGTLVAAVNAIGAIALAPAALPQASAGINAVICALRSQEKNLFAEAACKALGIHLRCFATRDRARHLSADFVINATVAKHNADAKVQNAAKNALQDPVV